MPIVIRTSIDWGLSSKPRVVLAIDRVGWAFHNIALELKQYCTDFNITIVPYIESGNFNQVEADLVVCFWWGAIQRIKTNYKAKHYVSCLYDFYTMLDPNDPNKYTPVWNKLKNISDTWIIGNNMLREHLHTIDNIHTPIYVCSDGVNTNMFGPTELPDRFTIGWSGNSKMNPKQNNKGLAQIVEAARITNTPLVVRDTRGDINNAIKHEDMRDTFYKHISCYVCASKAEGTPNPVLESLACGKPVITTRVGITNEVVVEGDNGFFIDSPTPEQIADKINLLKHMDMNRLGKNARYSVLNISWEHKARIWEHALNKILLGGAEQ